MRVGVIGVGRWGRQLIRVFAEESTVTICSNQSNLDAHLWLQDMYPGIRSTFDNEEVLRSDDVDAVVIATPVPTHARIATEAIRAKKHVFVEKPLAVDPVEAAALVAQAEDEGVALFVGHTFLYHPVASRLLDMCRHDRPRMVHLEWRKLGTFAEPLEWNLLPHDAAFALCLFGGVPERAGVLERGAGCSDLDHLRVELEWGAGRCVIDIDRCQPERSKSAWILTDSGLVLVWRGSKLYRYTDRKDFEEIYSSPEEPLRREVRAFFHHVEGKREGVSDPELAVDVTSLIASLGPSIRG